MEGLDRFTRNLDWNLLKFFFQIARSGSIGAAAAKMNVSQPSVSVALRRLEASIGAQLFVRTRTGVQLTAAGRLLLKDTEAMVSMVAAKPLEIGGITGALAGSVRVKTVSHVFSPALDEGVIGFKVRHPNVELSFETAPWRGVIQALTSGDAMVGIGFDDLRRPEIDCDLLTVEPVQVYCGPSHPLHGTTLKTLAAIVDEPFVTFSDGEPPALAAFRQKHGIGHRISGVADSIYEASWMIGLGIGIGLLPTPTIEAAPTAHLWPMLAPELQPHLEVLLMRRSGLQDRATRVFVDLIVEQIALRKPTVPPKGAEG
jgi:DNA-binding transcriptional LysR family regulator